MHKKIKFTLIVVFSLFFYSFLSNSCYAMTSKEVGEVLAQFAINFADNYGVDAQKHGKENQTFYDYDFYRRGMAYDGKKTSGAFKNTYSYTNKYAMDCVGWIAFALRHSGIYFQATMSTSLNGEGNKFCITPDDYGEGVGGDGAHAFEMLDLSTPLQPRRHRSKL